MNVDKMIRQMWSAVAFGKKRKRTREERKALKQICSEIEEWLADDEPHAMLDPEKFNV